MSLNKVMLIGHVGSMEIKSFEGQNGPRKCATFSLATTERYKDRTGNLVNNTEWHNIVSWNHAEVCEKYVSKGSQIYVEGKLRTRSWDDKDGNLVVEDSKGCRTKEYLLKKKMMRAFLGIEIKEV